MKALSLRLFLWSHCIVATESAIRFLTSQQLFNGMQEDRFDVVGDVRSAEDYARGHIPNVTHLELLHLAGRANQRATVADLDGCEFCHIVLYSTDGNRAQDALLLLENAGFKNLYNGLGVDQWAFAGYPLVTRADNVVPRCTVNPAVSAACEAKHLADNPTAPAAPPVRAPTPVAAPVRPPVAAPSPAFPPSVPIKKSPPKDPVKDALKLSTATDISRGSLNRRRRVRGNLE